MEINCPSTTYYKIRDIRTLYDRCGDYEHLACTRFHGQFRKSRLLIAFRLDRIAMVETHRAVPTLNYMIKMTKFKSSKQFVCFVYTKIHYT